MPINVNQGITPAYAGKSCVFVFFCVLKWDHPRVCGEKLLVLPLVLLRRGSPPRMRGKGKTVHCGKK